MATSAPTISGLDRGRNRRTELTLIALFWSAAFALSSARGEVIGEIPFALIAPHRAAVMAFGALLCWATIYVLEAKPLRTFGQRALAGVAGALLLTVVQTLFHMLSCRVAPIPGYPPISAQEALSSGMISLGYFVGWIWMHLALLYHRELQGGVRAAAPPPAASAQAEADRSFWASRHRQTVRVREDEISWVEAQRDYVMLHTRAGGGGMLRATLASVQERLGSAEFVRVHRSALVRRSDIAAIRRRPTGALEAELESGGAVPVGRSYAPEIRSLLASR